MKKGLSFSKEIILKHEDSWLGIKNNEIVCSDKDGEKVFECMKQKFPNEIPLIIKVPSETSFLL